MYRRIKKQNKRAPRAKKSKRAAKLTKPHGARYVKKSRDAIRSKKSQYTGKSKKIKKPSQPKTSKGWRELYAKNTDMEKKIETRGAANKNWKELYAKNVDLERKTVSEDAVKVERMFEGDNVEVRDVVDAEKGRECKEKLRILIIEADVSSAELAKSAIVAANPSHDVEIGKDDTEGMEKLASKEFDLILLNYKLPHIGGLEFLDKTKDMRRDTPVIMVADEHDGSVAAEAFRKGASEYVTKSDDYFKNLPSIVEGAVAKRGWMSLYTKNVELETKTADVTTAEGAIEIVKAFQKDLLESTGRIDNSMLVIELHNAEEFNKFSRMVTLLKNVKIKNIQVLGSTYQITIWAIPESFNIIR